jgi:hypothetical protein
MSEIKLSDAAILNLIKQGTVTKDVKIIDGITITLKNLTQEDRENYSKLIDLPKMKTNDKETSNKEQEEELNNTLYLLMETSKVPILVYAITKINDTDFSSMESKSTLHKLLLQLPPVFIDKAYNAYVENEQVINDIFNDENVKKN